MAKPPSKPKSRPESRLVVDALPEKVKRKPKATETDPKTGKVTKRRDLRTKTGAKLPWYHTEGKERANLLVSHVQHLRQVPLASYRRDALNHMRMYAGTWNVNGTDSTLTDRQLRYNLVRSCTDTAASILSAARTLPFNQTRGADWALRRKMLERNQVLQQQIQSIGMFEAVDRAILDGLVTRLGAVKVYEDPLAEGGLAGCERVLPLSLVWDPRQAVDGTPEDLFQVFPISRDVLIETFARNENGSYDEAMVSAIQKAPGPNALDKTDFQMQLDSDANQCMVVEGWHLPSSPEAGDGKHTISIPNCELHGEDWTCPRFPFGFFRGFEPGMLGFAGVSIPDLVKSAQLRIEQLADHIQKCQDLGSSPKVFIPKGSRVEPDEMTNAALEMIEFDGPTPPVFFQFDATPHDLEATIDRIREQTLSMLGMSTQQVQGERPAGVTSAVGQKAAEEISSKRHIRPLRFLEKSFLQCFQALADVNDRIAVNNPDFSIDRGARDTWLDSSKWKDLIVEEGQAKLAVLPVSQLVGSAAAQKDTVAEWTANGWLAPSSAKVLQMMPDSEGSTDDETVDERYSHDLVDQLLDGKKIGVDPVLDVTIFAPILRDAYLQARMDKAPEPILAQFRSVMNVVKGREDAAKAAQQAVQAQMAPPPGAVPPGMDPAMAGAGGLPPTMVGAPPMG